VVISSQICFNSFNDTQKIFVPLVLFLVIVSFSDSRGFMENSGRPILNYCLSVEKRLRFFYGKKVD